MISGQRELFLEDRQFVSAVLVQADLADAQDIGLVEKLGDDGDDLACEGGIFGFLGVDADPAEVLDAVFGGPAWLLLGEVPEVIVEPAGRTAIKPRPERRLGDGHTARLRHPLIVVCGAGDHVDVRVDVFHGAASPGYAPWAPFMLAAEGMGSVV